MPCLPVPLSTLHVQPCGCPRMTRGQDGSLFLSCRTLLFPIPCRFIPAHSAFIRGQVRAAQACITGYNKCVADTTAPPVSVLPFEACLHELEKVVKELEGGDLPLERSLELFEKGMRLSDTCRKQLEEAETRVEMLIRKEGKIQAEPYRPEKA